MTHKTECATIQLAQFANSRWWPVCDCNVDPIDNLVYGSSNTGETRSTKMSNDFEDLDYECGNCGDDHWEDECPDMDFNDAGEDNIQTFLGRLETFLTDEIEEECRGNVFLSETEDNKVAINILVGVPFEGGPDKTCSQINVIIAPTDREYLASNGVTVNDNIDRPHSPTVSVEEPVKNPAHSWFDSAMRIFRND